MNRYEMPMFPGWETTRLIGRGNYGAVYEIERDVFGEKEKCALKHVSIPREESEIRSLRIDGLDDASITESFTHKAKTLVSEYNLMIRLNDCPNVVTSYDINVNKKKDIIGWDLYIRMELLTPLTELLLTSKVWDEAEILSLGKDICSALVSCQKYNILHRDIKPENIFISEDGIYKLGDFGIARLSDREGSLTMQIGTYSYMAPEVFAGEEYGTAADICSLGIVLYWFLNGRHLPFMKGHAPGEKENAIARRMSGETILPPANGSESFKRVVLKACAFNPKNRYQTAAEMLEDLMAVKLTSKSADAVIEEPTEAIDADYNFRLPDDGGTVGIADYIGLQSSGNEVKRTVSLQKYAAKTNDYSPEHSADRVPEEDGKTPLSEELSSATDGNEIEAEVPWYEAEGTVSVRDWITRPLLESGEEALNEGNWINADQFFDKALDQDSKNARAYLGKLMAERHVRRQEELADCVEPLERSENYKKAVNFGGKKYSGILEEYNARILRRKEYTPKSSQPFETAALKSVHERNSAAGSAVPGFDQEEGIFYKRDKGIDEVKRENEAKRLEANLRAVQEREAARQLRIEKGLLEKVENDEEAANKNRTYDLAVSCMSENTLSGYESAIKIFQKIPKWRNADILISECRNRIEEIKRENEAKRLEANLRTVEKRNAEMEAETANKSEEMTRKDAVYSLGKTEMARRTPEGYKAAIRLFQTIRGWKDTEELIVLCRNRIIGINNPNIRVNTNIPVKTAPTSAAFPKKWLCDCGYSNPASVSECPICGKRKAEVYNTTKDKKKNVWEDFRDQFM